MKKFFGLFIMLVLMVPILMGTRSREEGENGNGCTGPVSSSGVTMATASVQVQANGLTVEQQNVKERLAMDNKIGSIKYLYVISPYSGQCIMYSTVKGKVTSSGKRLSPRISEGGNGFLVRIDSHNSYYTNEVLEDDGTYGDSSPYIYWWDTKGIYHQMFLTGSVMVSISDQPLPVKSVVINVSSSKSEE